MRLNMKPIWLPLLFITFMGICSQEAKGVPAISYQQQAVEKEKTKSDLALDSLEVVLKSKAAAEDDKLRADALLNYSNILETKGALKEAIDSVSQAIKLLEKITPRPFAMLSYGNLALGNVYHSESELYERNSMFSLADSSASHAAVFYKKAYLYGDSANSPIDKANALMNLGNTAVQLFKDEEAEDYYLRALEIARAEGNENQKAIVWLNLGRLAFFSDNMEKALGLFLKSKDVFIEVEDYTNLISTNINLATIYQHSDPNKAIEILNEADSISRVQRFLDQKGLIHEFLYIINKEQGNFAKALNHFEIYRNIQDSILTSTFKDKELQVRFETAKKQEMLERARAEKLQKELALAKSEQEMESYRLWLIIGASLSIFLIAFLVWRNRTQKIIRAQEDKIHQQQVQELEQGKKIESARALLTGQDKERKRIAEQIHDKLGGTLVAARMWSELTEAETQEINEHLGRTKKLLDQAIEDARSIAHSLHPSSLAKFGLKSALSEMIESFNIPGGAAIEASITKVENLDSQQEFQLYLIAQEALSNAIKHSEATSIVISLSQENQNEITLGIQDNGQGFNPDNVDEGIGMKTIYSRANSLNAEVTLNTSPGRGTKYKVSLKTIFNEQRERHTG